jgi:hypothetical protein
MPCAQALGASTAALSGHRSASNAWINTNYFSTVARRASALTSPTPSKTRSGDHRNTARAATTLAKTATGQEKTSAKLAASMELVGLLLIVSRF